MDNANKIRTALRSTNPPGERDPQISILRIAIQAASKHRKRQKTEIAAIERYKQPDGAYIHLQTPLPANVAKQPQKIKAYLDDHRATQARYLPDDQAWTQGIKYGGSQDLAATPRQTTTTQYTSDCAGDLAHKSPAQLKRLIKQAEASNREFMAILTVC